MSKPNSVRIVSFGIVGVSDCVPVFFLQFGKFQGDHQVDRRMAAVVRGVVGQGSQGESVLVHVSGVAKQCVYKIAAPHIVNQVTEEHAAKWVVPHILHQRTAVGVGVCLKQVVFRRTGEPLEQERLNLVLPHQVYDLLMGQNRISPHRTAKEAHRQSFARSDLSPIAYASRRQTYGAGRSIQGDAVSTCFNTRVRNTSRGREQEVKLLHSGFPFQPGQLHWRRSGGVTFAAKF
jgi:hypothetical protein